jgi:hypothetical protein|tara:strand:- start:10635 stop:10844 length:210 start_codon:yes stop_codon:yes gene_type:complete
MAVDRDLILDALVSKYDGIIAEARANIEIYLTNPVGIGEHPDVLAAIDAQVEILANAKEKQDAIEMLDD